MNESLDWKLVRDELRLFSHWMLEPDLQLEQKRVTFTFDISVRLTFCILGPVKDFLFFTNHSMLISSLGQDTCSDSGPNSTHLFACKIEFCLETIYVQELFSRSQTTKTRTFDSSNSIVVISCSRI